MFEGANWVPPPSIPTVRVLIADDITDCVCGRGSGYVLFLCVCGNSLCLTWYARGR